jgi:hypothetical protein
MESGKETPPKTEPSKEQEEITSKAVRAGKRTYFFDVKATRGGDYYLTITESKKRFSKDGQSFYEKHKIFLYKEDFDKFVDGLKEIIEFIKANNPVTTNKPEEPPVVEKTTESTEYSHVEFDDLEK